MIETIALSKQYTVYRKEPGFLGSVRSFFSRDHHPIDAVKDLTFQVSTGEIVGFLGPNGAGKTTTLKMLSGLLHPTSGRVLVAGHTPKERSGDFLRSIALVMGQKMQLQWDVSAADSILLVLKEIYDIPSDQFLSRQGELVEMLGLQDVVRRPVRQLSLGERMKCELAAALLHRPKVLFLDEPTIGLDVNAQAAVREFVINYNSAYNATILITSHYMADVTALASRVMVIDTGRQIFDGDLSALVERHSPEKVLRVRVQGIARKTDFDRYGVVRLIEGSTVELAVPRGEIVRRVSEILSSHSIADIGIEEPSIEEVIRTVFQRSDTKDVAAA